MAGTPTSASQQGWASLLGNWKTLDVKDPLSKWTDGIRDADMFRGIDTFDEDSSSNPPRVLSEDEIKKKLDDASSEESKLAYGIQREIRRLYAGDYRKGISAVRESLFELLWKAAYIHIRQKAQLDAKDKELATARATLNACKTELASKGDEVKEASERNESLEKERNDLREKLEKAEKDLADFQANGGNLGQALLEKEKERDDLSKQVKELTQRASELEAAIAAEQTKSSEATQTVSDLTAALDETKSKLTEAEDELAKLKLGSEALEDARSKLERERDALKSQFDSVSGEKADVEAKNASLSAENQTLESERSDLKVQRDDLDAERATLEAEKHRLSAEVKALEEEKQRLETALRAVESTEKLAKDESNALRTELDAERKSLASLRQSAPANAKTLSDHASKIAALESENANNMAQVLSLEIGNRMLKAQVDGLSKDVARLKAENGALRAGADGAILNENRRLEAESAKVKALLDVSDSKLSAFRKQCEADKKASEDRERRLAEEARLARQKAEDDIARIEKAHRESQLAAVDAIQMYAPAMADLGRSERRPTSIVAPVVKGYASYEALRDAAESAMRALKDRMERNRSVARSLFENGVFDEETARQLNLIQSSVITDHGGKFVSRDAPGMILWKFSTGKDAHRASEALESMGFRGASVSEHPRGGDALLDVPVVVHRSPNGSHSSRSGGGAESYGGVTWLIRECLTALAAKSDDRQEAIRDVVSMIGRYYRADRIRPSGAGVPEMEMEFEGASAVPLAEGASDSLKRLGLRHVLESPLASDRPKGKSSSAIVRVSL